MGWRILARIDIYINLSHQIDSFLGEHVNLVLKIIILVNHRNYILGYYPISC